MTGEHDSGLLLTFGDGRPPARDLVEVNAALAPIGMRIWPLDLSGLPAAMAALLERAQLGEAERLALRDHLLLPRRRLLEMVSEAGRQPHFPDGGALETRVVTHGIDYPQLYLVAAGQDFSRFDRYHRNLSAEGAGTDEIFQFVSGGGLKLYQRLPDDIEAVLTLECPAPDRGWCGTFDGGRPHIGSVSSARPGSKILVQIIGPEAWEMRYD